MFWTIPGFALESAEAEGAGFVKSERIRGPNPPWAFAAPEPAVGPALVRSPSTVGPADAGWLAVITGKSGRVSSPNICGVIEVGAGSAGCTGSSASVVLGGENGFITGTV